MSRRCSWVLYIFLTKLRVYWLSGSLVTFILFSYRNCTDQFVRTKFHIIMLYEVSTFCNQYKGSCHCQGKMSWLCHLQFQKKKIDYCIIWRFVYRTPKLIFFLYFLHSYISHYLAQTSHINYIFFKKATISISSFKHISIRGLFWRMAGSVGQNPLFKARSWI